MGIWRAAGELTAALRADGSDVRLTSRPTKGVAAHFHYGNSTRKLLFDMARRSGDIVSLHDAVPRDPRLRRVLAHLQARVIQRHHLIAHSEHAVDLFREFGWSGEATIVQSLLPVTPIDTERVAALRRAWKCDDFALTLVSAGQIRASKGIGEILEAARECPSARIVLVGSIPDPEMASLVANAPGNVLQVEAPDDESFCHCLAATDALLSIRRKSVGETSGPVVQAHRLLKPVLGLRVGSLPETCGEGDILLDSSASAADLIAEAERVGLGPLSPDSSQVPRPEEIVQQVRSVYKRAGFGA